MSKTEELRQCYRPATVSVLFVGEAPPAGGTFFYAGNSQVHRSLREALDDHLGRPADFLQAFSDRGYFLTDLVLDPVDHLTKRERRPLLEAGMLISSES